MPATALLPAYSVNDVAPADMLSLARAGDDQSFAQLVALLQPRVYRWALTYARDPDEADEIAQQTFVLIHRQLEQFRGDAPVEAWAFSITRRVADQRRRTFLRRSRLASSPAGRPDREIYVTDPGARVDRQRVAALIREFFAGLPPRQREVFDLIDLQGYDPAEVAVMLGAKAVTVRANLFKARSTIRARVLATHPAWAEVDR
ncbi:MAG: RNA polymerase sigma factor [Gemmatimonadota bacterium]|nr:RNA polymerase sigma factor [Gemmatimonadota bacterium]